MRKPIGFTKSILEKEYWSNEKSAKDISKKYECSQHCVLFNMKRFEIPRRERYNAQSLKISNHCNLDKIEDIINGLVMSDGNLCSRSRISAGFRLKNKFEGYLKLISKLFERSGLEQSGHITKDSCGIYCYKTKDYMELKNFYNRWYPNGKKIVPLDLTINKSVLLYWFISDGYFYDKKSRQVGLATQSFSLKENKVLLRKLSELNINAHIQTRRYKKQTFIFRGKKSKRKKILYSIRFCDRKSIRQFFNLIGKCPKKINQYFGYKWGRGGSN